MEKRPAGGGGGKGWIFQREGKGKGEGEKERSAYAGRKERSGGHTPTGVEKEVARHAGENKNDREKEERADSGPRLPRTIQ